MTFQMRTRFSKFVALATSSSGAAAVFASLIPSSAAAGTFTVSSCRAPDGTPAAVGNADGGWRSASVSVSDAGGNRLGEACAGGGALEAALATAFKQPAPSFLIWDFDAPPFTTIERYSLDLSGYTRPRVDGQSFGDLSVANGKQSDPEYDARFAGQGVVPRQTIERDGRSSAKVRVLISCTPNGQSFCEADAAGSPARVSIYRGTFTLADRDAPAVTSVSGDATTDAIWAGSTGISDGATDQCGGVYRLGVEVDGQIRSWLNLAGAPCQPYPGTERTFLAPKPCPSTVGGVQTLSTADLPEGSHTVRILVEDAAGNQTTAYGPVSKTLSRTAIAANDPGPLNGSPAVTDARMTVSWEGRESASKSIRYDQQPVLRGQLTTAQGQPIKDAAVRVTITRDARNSPPFERESLSTNSEGRFRWKIPKGSSSRKIVLSYRQRVRDAKPVVSKTLRLVVKAGVRLKLSRRTARKGQAVKLTGTVLGRPVPRGGKLVELQARNRGGRWITFRTVRTRKSGAFAATYRFRNPGPARFQMRARARKSGDYPYATGSSPVRGIRIR
jgi:hypothetical protein